VVVPWMSVVVAVSLSSGAVRPGQETPACLLPPVVAPVVDPYREPACRWCAGNRGVTYGAVRGAVVRAAAAGTVTFSGDVAGVRYVVVAHAAGGLRATYGGLGSTRLGAGDRIARGDVVGVAAGEVHFGLRRGEAYVDPTPMLGRVVARPRLVPTDGTARRPGPPPRLDCTGAVDPMAAAAPMGPGEPRSSAAVLPLAGVALADWLAPHHDYPAVDVMVPTGTPVAAWRGGTVRNVHDDRRRPCGIGLTVVDVSWPDVTWTYCHLSRRDVAAGDVLTAGQHVGRSGDTGRSGAPHLHLEVRVGGRRVCPQPALRSIATRGAMTDPHRLPASGCSS